MSGTLTRRALVCRAARGGAALVAVGGALGQFVGTAEGDPLPSSDLAYARLLVAAELLASDFYTQAVAAGNARAAVRKRLRRAYANEQEHYHSVAQILTGSGATPAVAADIDFSYPKGTFASEAAVLAFARRLETVLLGAYLGAVGGVQAAGLKQGLAQIAACEAEHLSYFGAAEGGPAFPLSFPPPLTIEQASDAMDAFTA